MLSVDTFTRTYVEIDLWAEQKPMRSCCRRRHILGTWVPRKAKLVCTSKP